MTLGTGIFLAAIVMSLTVLFIATKDRWNWKKILLWPLGICVAGGLAMWGYIEYQKRFPAKPEPTVHNSFWDIPLGATPDDVVFKKGKPTQKKTGDGLFSKMTELPNRSFDAEGARRAGYSDEEIADYLVKKGNFNVEGTSRADQYAAWIVANKDKKGTPEFNTVAQAYKRARSILPPPSDATFPNKPGDAPAQVALTIEQQRALAIARARLRAIENDPNSLTELDLSTARPAYPVDSEPSASAPTAIAQSMADNGPWLKDRLASARTAIAHSPIPYERHTSSPASHDEAWTYSAGREQHLVVFRENHVRLIIQYGASAYSAIDGIGIGGSSSTSDVTSTFGEPAFVAKEDEGETRIYCYPAHQVLFRLNTDRVTELGIYDRASPPSVCEPPAKDDAIKK